MTKPTAPILYFIQGETPTAKEFEDAAKYMNKGSLKFISLVHLDLNAPKLEFSDVKGSVPEQYKPAPIVEVAPKETPKLVTEKSK